VENIDITLCDAYYVTGDAWLGEHFHVPQYVVWVRECYAHFQTLPSEC